jgi:nucleoside-diphosphate-sugar epimerase
MLDAAKAAEVKRFIHIGTEAALFHGQHLRNADETYPLALNSPYPYSSTKAKAEQLVRETNAPGFETIVLRPRFIWGPGDTTLLPTIVAMARSWAWSWINHGRAMTSTTHIDNLVHAIELALTEGRAGEAYFVLDDGVRPMHEMPERSIPAWAAEAAGALCETLWRTLPLKSQPPLTRISAMILSRDAILRDDKARAEMGYRPVISVEDGMRRLAA